MNIEKPMPEQDGFESPLIIEHDVFHDARGYFCETFNAKRFAEETGIVQDFVQDNESCSSKYVIRGLHYQEGVHNQAKLVRVISGKVADVIVDIRKGSANFGKWVAVCLSGNDHKMLYVPNGFAHGFITLDDNTVFSYKCSSYYNKESERGIIWNDPDIGIKWDKIVSLYTMLTGITMADIENDVTFSEKDRKWPRLKDIEPWEKPPEE